MITIKELKVGDIVENQSGYRCEVLVITGKLIALSSFSNYNNFSIWKTEHELKDYTLIKPEWKPENLKGGDEYWYINNFGSVETRIFANDKGDNFRIKTKNCFPNEESAEKRYKEIMGE